MCRFIQTAEMLKPPTPTTSQDEELVEYFPHVMFVHTNMLSSYFAKDKLQLMQVYVYSTYTRVCVCACIKNTKMEDLYLVSKREIGGESGDNIL